MTKQSRAVNPTVFTAMCRVLATGKAWRGKFFSVVVLLQPKLKTGCPTVFRDLRAPSDLSYNEKLLNEH